VPDFGARAAFFLGLAPTTATEGSRAETPSYLCTSNTYIKGNAMRALSLSRFFIAFAIVLGAASAARADAGLIIKTSPYGVTQTLDRLEKIMKKKGLTIFARIDHAAGAKRAGLDLPATQVLIFGNPKLGTPLMRSRRTIAIDLPQKALAWKGADGKTRLAYNDPAYLAQRHGIEDRKKIVKKMAGALNKLTSKAAGK